MPEIITTFLELGDANYRWRATGWNAPSIEDLNEQQDGEFDLTGVVETKQEDLPHVSTMARDWLEQENDGTPQEMNVSRIMLIDVRGIQRWQ